MEFHIARSIREQIDLNDLLFAYTGNVIFANVTASRKLAERLNALNRERSDSDKSIRASELFAMGLIDELSHALIAKYRKNTDPLVLKDGLRFLTLGIGQQHLNDLLLTFTQQFPNVAVFRNEVTAEQWLKGSTEGLTNQEAAFEEMLLLWLANTNPAFASFSLLFGDEILKSKSDYSVATSSLPNYFATRPPVEPTLGTLLEVL
jgi:hypothetical protein